MKKKLAALLCGVMCFGSLTGCSPTELSYLKTSKDMLDTMKNCRVSGSTQLDVDMGELEGFLEDVAEATRGEFSAEDLPEGKKSIKLDYDLDMNLNTLDYDLALDVTYEGKKYDMGSLYYSLNDGIYVTSDTLWGVYQLAGNLMEEKPSYFNEAYEKDLKAILAEDPYIELVSVETLTGGMGDLYDAAFKFYEDMLEGFESGMVQEISGGYAIRANGEEAAQLLVNLLDFVAKNPDQIIDATEVYINAVLEQMPDGTEEAKVEMANLFAQARSSRDDFVEAAADLRDALKEIFADQNIAALLRGCSYQAELKKNGNDFAATGAYTVTNKGKAVLSLQTKETITKSNRTITMPKDAVTLDEMAGKLKGLEDKYNPVTGVNVQWGFTDANDIATLSSTRTAETIFDTESADADLMIKDGRAYLPLRVICDALGETVGWENATKTPYVTQDGKRIDMKGLLQGGKAFVGVREFEKLGYTVTYTSYDEGYKEAKIVK